MRVLFIGCVRSSELFLNKLLQMKADIVGVVTKAEAGINADFVDIGQICEKNQLDYIYVKNINEPESRTYIQQKKPDLILCLGWSQLLDEEILKIPAEGCIGFHPAKLPYNRGRHPLIWALALGLESTASTFFYMDAHADTGEIVSQRELPISYEDDAASLYHKVMNVAVDQLEEIMNDLGKNMLQKLSQEIGTGNVWRKRGKRDGEIDWRMSSRAIYNLVRALTKPYVGAHFIYQDQEIKVWKVREIITKEYNYIEPGKVLSVTGQMGYRIKAGDNVIELVQCEPVHMEIGEYL